MIDIPQHNFRIFQAKLDSPAYLTRDLVQLELLEDFALDPLKKDDRCHGYFGQLSTAF